MVTCVGRLDYRLQTQCPTTFYWDNSLYELELEPGEVLGISV